MSTHLADSFLLLVIQAYNTSLRITFLSATIWASIMLVLTAMVKLPRLRRTEKVVEEETN